MNYSLFSIIVPTYNSARTLQRALDSILHQSFSNFEVVIIDGLSTDDTINIIGENKNKDSRIKFISEKDNGIYDAMNKGIDMATGQWLYFLGSDDSLTENTVLQRVSENLQNTDATLFYGEVLLKGKRYDGRFNMDKLLQKNISHQAIFYKKEVFEQLGNYTVRFKLHADWEFNIRYFLKFENNAFFGKILVANFEEGGVSAGHDVLFIREFLLPLKLQRMNTDGSSINSIKLYDEYWRLVRNAGIRNNNQLLESAGENNIPTSIKKMVEIQERFSPQLLRNGFVSKFIMFVCYFAHLFIKEK